MKVTKLFTDIFMTVSQPFSLVVNWPYMNPEPAICVDIVNSNVNIQFSKVVVDFTKLEKMVDERKFRNMVTNQFMENVEYLWETYSFLTVFSKSAPTLAALGSTYRCCSCAHDHEYLEYILDTGEVNEKLYDKIVNSLAIGKCPHADAVSKDELVSTSITGLHIAAAVGTERAVKENLEKCCRYMTDCGIFNLYPFDTAMVKKQTNICNLFVNYWLSHDAGYLYSPHMATVNGKSLHIQEVSRLEFCVRQANNQLLQTITTNLSKTSGFGEKGIRNIQCILTASTPNRDLAHALQFTMKYQLLPLQHTLVQYMQLLSKYNILTKEIRNDCLLSVLMYNNRRLLEQMLKFLDLKGTNENKFISKCCMVLQNRENCTNLLSHRRFIRPVRMSKEEHIDTIFTLFGIFYNDFKNELKRLLESAPGIQQGFIKSSLLNQIPSFRHYDHDIFVAQLVLSIIELGKTETLVHDAMLIVPQLQEMLLYNSTYHLHLRYAVELLIHENVEIDTEKVILRDSKFPFDLRRGILYHYITDVKQHGVYGHDGEDLVLNYLCPFLLACGYDVPRCCLFDILMKKSDKESKLAEQAYINNYLDTPRSLLVCCRNSLRKRFRGRYIHRFVKVSGCPQTIKDIILLKYLLRCIRE